MMFSTYSTGGAFALAEGIIYSDLYKDLRRGFEGGKEINNHCILLITSLVSVALTQVVNSVVLAAILLPLLKELVSPIRINKPLKSTCKKNNVQKNLEVFEAIRRFMLRIYECMATNI